jgi:hypothetical protein
MFPILPTDVLPDGKWLGISLSIPGNAVSVTMAATSWPAFGRSRGIIILRSNEVYLNGIQNGNFFWCEIDLLKKVIILSTSYTKLVSRLPAHVRYSCMYLVEGLIIE